MGAGFNREPRLNPWGQWCKSWTDPGPQTARDRSWALISGFDSTFIVSPEICASLLRLRLVYFTVRKYKVWKTNQK